MTGPLVDGTISGGMIGIEITGDGEPAEIVNNVLADFCISG
jgi:hypothetical protein